MGITNARNRTFTQKRRGEWRKFNGNTLMKFPIYVMIFPKGAMI